MAVIPYEKQEASTMDVNTSNEYCVTGTNKVEAETIYKSFVCGAMLLMKVKIVHELMLDKTASCIFAELQYLKLLWMEERSECAPLL